MEFVMSFNAAFAVAPGSAEKGMLLNELFRFLERLPDEPFRRSVEALAVPPCEVDANRLAAWIEVACRKRTLPPPAWTATVPPLRKPWFPVRHDKLRLELMINSPVECKRRKIFELHGYGDAV